MQDSEEHVVLAVKKSNISTGFTALNPHNHDLPNRPPDQALTEADKLLFEKMLHTKTPFQVRQDLLLQQREDATVVVPSMAELAQLSRQKKQTDADLEQVLQSLETLKFYGAVKYLVKPQEDATEHQNEHQTDFILLQRDERMPKLWAKHNEDMTLKNPGIGLKPLVFMDGTGGIFADRSGLTLLLGYFYPAHRFEVLAILNHTGRSPTIYKHLLDVARESLANVKADPIVILDFEKAEDIGAHLAMKCEVKGCWFHAKSAIMERLDEELKKVQRVAEFKEKKKVAEEVAQMVDNIHFAKSRNDCMEYVDILLTFCKKTKSRLSQFADYFTKNWIKARGGALEKWTLFNFVETEERRKNCFYLLDKNDTNNASETTVRTVKQRSGNS